MLRLLLVVLLSLECLGGKPVNICVKHIESPQYPQLARLAQIAGDVTVKVFVSPDGKVVSAAATTGPAILGQYATENVKKWIFDEGGEQEFDIVFRFRLEKPAVDYAPPPKVTFDLPNSVEIVSKYATPNE